MTDEDKIIEQVHAAVRVIEGVDSAGITKGAGTINVLYKGAAKPAEVYAELNFGDVGKALRAEKLALLVHRKL